MEKAIEGAIGRLRGLPLWRVGRSGMVWFQFGERRIIPTARGRSKEVGEFALHLSCPWRLVGPDDELLAGDESAAEVLAGLASPPLLCSMARVLEGEDFELGFDGGERLHVEPEDMGFDEYWRLLRPYSGEPHFVVGPAGIDPEG